MRFGSFLTFLASFLCIVAAGAEAVDPALVPVTPAEGIYPAVPELWRTRHQTNLTVAAKQTGPLDLLLLGDSITALWGNSPNEGEPDHLQIWTHYFGQYSALNFGIGGDKTENVLWRIEHGEVDGLDTRVVILTVGVNNLFNLPVPREAIAAGVEKCVAALQARLPRAEVVVINLFPHEESPRHLARKRGEEARVAIRALGLESRPHVHLLDLQERFLEPDGTLKPELFLPDHLHLTHAGYEVYAQGLAPLIAQLLGR